AEPQLVAACVAAMRDAVSLTVTVKHRIGIDDIQEYSFVRDFVGTVANAGAEVFIVHARNAILKGLSPKENRELPPLRYEVVRAFIPYVQRQLAGGTPLRSMTRHILGLYHGMPGARSWRRTLSDARLLERGEATLLLKALAEVEPQAVDAAL